MKQSVGWGDREGCGGGRVGDNELICSCTGGVEVIEVIKAEFQVGSHGMVIQMVKVSQSDRVTLLYGGIEGGGEELDWVVGGRWQKIGGGRRW